MVDFKGFQSNDDAPIYVQIVDFVKREIVASRIVDGDVMPSRRVLSSLIGVNPNTIQKSYKILEEEGVIISQSGAKSYISINDEKIRAIKEDMIRQSLSDTISDLKHMGISKNRANELFDKYWEEDDGK